MPRTPKPFQSLIPVPGIEDYGAWRTFIWNNNGQPQHGVLLVPAVPPWQQLFAALDELGASLPVGPTSDLDEADAITACCWRYGSYFHLLTGGERYPPFRDDSAMSRLGQHEMRRINIEFSAALASWLTTKATAPERIERRVLAALTALPMPWRNQRPADSIDVARRVAAMGAARINMAFLQVRSERSLDLSGANPHPASWCEWKRIGQCS